MSDIKKREKSAHIARCDRDLQDTPDRLAVTVTAPPSYTKARRDNRCPFPPLPVLGALVHNAGSVLVIINSALLLNWRQKENKA